MTTGKEIAVYQSNISVPELRQFAMDFAKSGYFQDAREAVQAVVKIQAGRELGFGPVYSMTKIYIVKGKVAVSAETMGAMVKRSGRYDYRVTKYNDTEVELVFTDNGKDAFTSKFTMHDAENAGLVRGDDSGWKKWPRAMLMSKALSQGARIVCPHVISGTYTPEDFGIEPNAEGEYQEPKVEISAVESASDLPAPLPSEEPLPDLVNEPQRRKIFAVAKEKGITTETIKAMIARRFKKDSTTALTKADASELIEKLEKGYRLNEAGEWEL